MAYTHNNGKQRALIVPAGSIVDVESNNINQMADVLWDGQALTMFVHDLDECEESGRALSCGR